MNPPGRYASSDGSFARSTGNAAARGVVLIGIAVLIGILLLSQGFNGSGGAPSAATATTTTTTTVTTTVPDTATTLANSGDTTATTVPLATTTATARPPGEVKVVVANGTGVKGAAGVAKNELTAAGYVAEAKNAVTVPTELSTVYYVDGYAEEAKAVASVLGGTASLLRAAPADPLALIKSPTGLEGFQIFVILGADNAIS